MVSSADSGTYFRKGFGLKGEIEADLAADYDGQVVDYLKAHDYTLTEGGITIRLAKEFGFCYGVERAVEYAYQTRKKFPDRALYLVGEIIHNRSEEHTSELQSRVDISYAVFCLKK